MSDPIPFFNLSLQCESLREAIETAMGQVLDRTAFAGGPFVEDFEEEFARFCGSRFAVGVNSGTSALWLALLSLGVKRGDEVITTPLTFIATTEAISATGATPVFVDVLPDTLTIDPEAVERAITSQTKAILPVHLYGQPADMASLREVSERHDIPLVEDAAQAHGATYRERVVGTIGNMGCFSFYPSKNLGALGESGAVITDDGELARRLRMFRDHGQGQKNVHEVLGWNARMDGFQAAVLRVKLPYLHRWCERRRQIAKFYSDALSGTPGLQLPIEKADRLHVYHLYVVRTQNRESLLAHLTSGGIHCEIHYPRPVHLQPAYAHLGYDVGSFPVAEKAAQEVLSLPMYPELEESQVSRVAEAVGALFE